MAQNDAEQKLTQPAPKKRRGGFLKAFLLTAVAMVFWVPFVTILAAIILPDVSISTIIFTAVPVVLIALGFAITRRIQIAAGILAGTVIGLTVMWVTCFAIFEALGV
jgi:uncharacterized membrane-anchored protein